MNRKSPPLEWGDIAFAANWKAWPTVEAQLKKETDSTIIAKMIVFYADILAAIAN